MTIVKAQLSLYTTEFEPQVLIYNQNRTILQQLPITPEVRALFHRGEYKAFFHADYDKQTKKINLRERAKWQEW